MIKGSVHQNYIAVINMYVHNIGAFEDIKRQ